MKTLFLTILVFLIQTNKALSDQNYFVGVGSSIKLPFSSNNSAHSSNSKAIKLRPSTDGMIVTGKSVGTSTIRLGSKSHTIQVLSVEAYQSLLRLKTLTKDIPGLRVEAKQNRVNLNGELLRFSDWKKVTNKTVEEGWSFILQTKMTDAIKNKIRNEIENTLKDRSLPMVQISISNGFKALVSPELKKSLSTIESTLEPLGVEVLISETSLALEPMVGVKILVTELRKQFFQRYGIKWPTSYQAQVLPSLKSDTVSVLAQIEAVEDTGLGKILASPYILCRSGKSANFLAGGEIPIRVSQWKSSKMEWKKYGVQLNVKPKADRSGRMSIELATEVSTLDMAQAIDGVPGLLMNRIESHFDLREKKTIALSGLIKQEMGQNSSGLPLLSQIPILGALFSSKEYRSQQTELVIFVTPEVTDAHDAL